MIIIFYSSFLYIHSRKGSAFCIVLEDRQLADFAHSQATAARSPIHLSIHPYIPYLRPFLSFPPPFTLKTNLRFFFHRRFLHLFFFFLLFPLFFLFVHYSIVPPRSLSLSNLSQAAFSTTLTASHLPSFVPLPTDSILLSPP